MKYFVFGILGLFIYILYTIYYIPTISAQSPCGTGGTSRAQGLVTTPTIESDTRFYTSAEGGCIVDPKSVFVPFKIPTYEELKSLHLTQASSSIKKVFIEGDADHSNLNFNVNSVYSITGNLNLSGNPPATATRIGVVFVEGKLNISSNYTYGKNQGRGTVFVVKGDVNFTSSGNLTEIYANIISEGTICTASEDFNSPCPSSGYIRVSPANQLNIYGSLISLDSSKPVRLRRSLGSTNSTTPAEVVTAEPKYLVLLRNLLSDKIQKWSEVTKASFTLPTPIPSPIPTPTPFPTAGLVAYYKMDESSGTTVADVSGNSNIGTSNSSTNVGTGIIGRARSFNGSTDLVTITKSASLSSFTSLSVSGWVNPKDCVHGTSSHNTLVTQHFGILLAFNNSCLVANYVHTSLPAPVTWRGPDGGGASVPINRWSHMVLTWDGSTVRSYLNGSLISGSGTAGSGVWTNNNNSYYFGDRPGCCTQTLNGNLDEVGIWNRALSASEISALYNNGFGFTFGTAPTPTFPTANLAGYWKMDEQSGTQVSDATTNNNTGTSNSPTNIGVGKIGGARSFNGVSESINVPEVNTSMRLGANQTVSTWAKISGLPTTWVRLIGKGTNANRNYGLWIYSNGDILYQIYNLGASVGCNFLNSLGPGNSGNLQPGNAWHHIAGTYDGTTGKLYINGIQVHSRSCTVIPANNADRLTIANRGEGDPYLNGLIDEAGIWNRTLTGAEIADLYNSGNGLSFGSPPPTPTFPNSGLAAYYKLDEPSGVTVTDATTNNNTGTSTSSSNVDNGKIGSGRSFNGSSQYVNIPVPTTSSLNLSSVVTVSAWVKPSISTQLGRIFSRGTTYAVGYGISQYNTTVHDKFNVGLHGGGNFSGGPTIVPNRWYHIVGVTNGANSQIWVDGSLVATNTLSIAGGSNSHPAKLGAAIDSTNGTSIIEYFNGVIDEVGVWNRALTGLEIATLYNNGNGLTFGTTTPPPPAQGCVRINIGPFVTITIPGICF